MKTESLIMLLAGVAAVLFLCLGFLGLYQYAGLKYYIKAVSSIKEIPTESSRAAVWNDFVSPKSSATYSGIYAGEYGGREWVWGRNGLKSFGYKSSTVYSFFDGCSNSSYLPEDGSFFVRINFSEFNRSKWRENSKVGDWVKVSIDQGAWPKMAKDIDTYNFWPFLQQDRKTTCVFGWRY